MPSMTRPVDGPKAQSAPGYLRMASRTALFVVAVVLVVVSVVSESCVVDEQGARGARFVSQLFLVMMHSLDIAVVETEPTEDRCGSLMAV